MQHITFDENRILDLILLCRRRETGPHLYRDAVPKESGILMYRNCIADLQDHVNDVVLDCIISAKTILLSGTALADSPSREAALKAVMLAKQFGTKVIFDIDCREYP